MSEHETDGERRWDALYAREMAHRTANVLQRALAAVHLSRRGNPDHLDHAMECLAGASELHALLIDRSMEPVDLGERLKLVALSTGRACGADATVELAFDVQTLVVAAEHARRISMILSELVENSVRHAFRGAPGSILVFIRDDGWHTGLLVEDDGLCESWARAGGQGHAIVDGLARSLGASVRRGRSDAGGARVELVMPSVALVARAAVGSA